MFFWKERMPNPGLKCQFQPGSTEPGLEICSFALSLKISPFKEQVFKK